MAKANLQRLTSQISKSPSLSRAITRRSTSTTTPSFLRGGGAKVSDCIVKLSAIDPYGLKHDIIGLSGHTLLKALANHGMIESASHRMEDIDVYSAECEVHIAQEWLDKLPAPAYDEEYILQRNSMNQCRFIVLEAVVSCDEVTDGVMNLTEKLSAALVNVSMKEDLVKQHAKVAEEAVAAEERGKATNLRRIKSHLQKDDDYP